MRYENVPEPPGKGDWVFSWPSGAYAIGGADMRRQEVHFTDGSYESFTSLREHGILCSGPLTTPAPPRPAGRGDIDRNLLRQAKRVCEVSSLIEVPPMHGEPSHYSTPREDMEKLATMLFARGAK